MQGLVSASSSLLGSASLTLPFSLTRRRAAAGGGGGGGGGERAAEREGG